VKLFRGLERTDYQDVLRALGYWLDARGYRNVRVVEHDEGLTVQAMPPATQRVAARYETLLFTDDDLLQLLQSAYRRRTAGGDQSEPSGGASAPVAPPARSEAPPARGEAGAKGPSYEEQLRAVGRILDQRATAARDVCVLQAADGFVVYLLAARSTYDDDQYAPATVEIEPEELAAALDEIAGRKNRSGWWRR
jgi:hypothetical protein